MSGWWRTTDLFPQEREMGAWHAPIVPQGVQAPALRDRTLLNRDPLRRHRSGIDWFKQHAGQDVVFYCPGSVVAGPGLVQSDFAVPFAPSDQIPAAIEGPEDVVQIVRQPPRLHEHSQAYVTAYRGWNVVESLCTIAMELVVPLIEESGWLG